MQFLRILRSASEAGGGEAADTGGAQADQSTGNASGETQTGAASTNPGVKLAPEAREFLVKAGIDPEKATDQEKFDAVFKSRGELIQSERTTRQSEAAAKKQLASLELEKLLGVTQLDEEAKTKLHGFVARAGVFEETVELLLADGRIDDATARVLRAGNLQHAKDLIAVMPKSQTPAFDEAELFKKFRQQMGLGEDLSSQGSEGAGGDGQQRVTDRFRREPTKGEEAFFGALGAKTKR